MALRCKVIVRNVSNLSDARYCAGMGVDYYGFFTDTAIEEHLSPESFKEINEWLSGIEPVAEPAGQSIDSVSTDYGIEKFLLSEPDPDVLKSLDSKEFFLIVNEDSDINYLLTAIDIEGLNDNVLGVIVESGDEYLKSVLNNDGIKRAQIDVYYGGAIEQDSINEFLDNFPVAGISMKGSQEIRPGYKDYDHLADILEEIEIEE
ncbi:hypothetical protein OO013_09395 [Mangrovivirga sp. M17]|uniref:Phosphoribosylanthranilate isomerase n=1 Tax=Mangrovivirga halotolerans TaxID=2993936 RepID=A0ABT3RQL6_9BACT|nr:hypothetical protein [Mangrovivirga halotolerans]MCX2744079.1 hypothetical protein [Mangrovivirga halotolerans]